MDNVKNTSSYIIFGAGKLGQELLIYLKDQVAFFCDNDKNKVGTYIENIQVLSFHDFLGIHKKYNVIIAVDNYEPIKIQLEANKIFDYIVYESDGRKSGWRLIGRSTRKKTSKHNEKMKYFVDQTKEIDPIKNFVEFRKLVNSCKLFFNENELILYEMNNSESTHYGYGKALMDYAGIDEDYDRFPLVSHGAGHRYPKSSFSLNNFHIATIVSTEVFRKFHNQRVPWVPIFTVGPYIRYASAIYSQKELAGIRKHNGKTALIFISHSIETADVRYDCKRIIEHIMKNYVSQYKTVFVCAYWHDIDKTICDELNLSGVKVVSAGFRWDPLFIKRQRTLLELCDDVVFYGYSTAVSFALALQKPIYFHDHNFDFDVEESTEKRLGVDGIYNDDLRENYFDIVKKMSGNNDLLTEDEKNILCDNFGLDIKRSKEDIRNFYHISCDIWRNCDYQWRYYPEGVYRTYWQYQDEYDFEKLNILTKALGTGFLA